MTGKTEKKIETVEELMKWIEYTLVMPFEGTLITDNKEARNIHRRVTSHIRERFNKLKLMENIQSHHEEKIQEKDSRIKELEEENEKLRCGR